MATKTKKISTQLKFNDQQLSNQQKHAFHNAIFSWEAHLHHYQGRSKSWYLWAGLIMAALITYALVTAAWTFAVALITYSYIYIVTHWNDSKTEEIIVSEIGIKEGTHYYPYSHIKAFWIIYKPGEISQLHLLTSRKIMPEVVIQLADQDPAQIRNYLSEYILEREGQEERFVDLLCRTLKL